MNFLWLQFIILKTFPCYNKQLVNELPLITIYNIKDISLLQWTFSNYSTLAQIKKFWRLSPFVPVYSLKLIFLQQCTHRNCMMMMMGTGWLDPIQFILYIPPGWMSPSFQSCLLCFLHDLCTRTYRVAWAQIIRENKSLLSCFMFFIDFYCTLIWYHNINVVIIFLTILSLSYIIIIFPTIMILFPPSICPSCNRWICPFIPPISRAVPNCLIYLYSNIFFMYCLLKRGQKVGSTIL